MPLTPGWRAALCALGGMLAALANAAFPSLAWVVMTPLVLALARAPRQEITRLAVLWGVVQALPAFDAASYGGFTIFLLLGSNTLVRLLLARVIHAVTHRLPPAAWPLSLAGIMASGEWAAELLLGRFYWPLSLADMLSGAPIAIQLAAIGGTPLLNAAVAACGTGFSLAILTNHRRARAAWAMGALAIITVVVLHGRAQLAPSAWSAHARVAVVQGGVPNWAYAAAAFEPRIDEELEERYVRATATLQPGDVDLVIWPETAVRSAPSRLPAVLERVKAEARRLGATFVVGLPWWEDGEHINGVLMVAPDGRVDVAGKRILVPLHEVEYAPAGRQALFNTPLGSIGVMVCVESIHVRPSAELVQRGAQLLVVVANDAGFGDTTAGELHAQRAALRAVENQRAVVHAAQFRATRIYDDRGRLLASSPGPGPSLVMATVPLAR